MPSSYLLQFVGGLAFFFFGLITIHQSMNVFAGERFRNILAKSSLSRFRSIVTGIVVTFFLQSSSIVSVMCVGLTSSGLLSLQQAMAVLLGAGIGTTLVVLIFSLKSLVEWGLAVFIVGLLMNFLAQRKIFKITGQVLLGFGLIFFGLTVMSQAAAPLKTNPLTAEVFEFMANYPVWNFLLAGIFTALVHSSGIIMGILMTLAYSGSITLQTALPLILGANVGTSFTALMVSFNGKVQGKRIAWANLLLRTGGVALLAPFLPYVVEGIDWLNQNVLIQIFGEPLQLHGEVALCHFLFNLFVALFFLPTLPMGQKFICWLIPLKDEEQEFGPKYLDKNALATPPLAFAQAIRELTRMGEIVQNMFQQALTIFKKMDLDQVEKIRAMDHHVDILYKAIKFYLANLALQSLKEEESGMSIHLMTGVNELENVGDMIDGPLLKLAQKKWNRGIHFSEEGWQEICEMHRGTCETMALSLAAVSASSRELAFKVKDWHRFFTDRETQLKRSHLMRLHQGLKESIDSSSIHLELMSIFDRINASLIAMVSFLLPDKK